MEELQELRLLHVQYSWGDEQVTGCGASDVGIYLSLGTLKSLLQQVLTQSGVDFEGREGYFSKNKF